MLVCFLLSNKALSKPVPFRYLVRRRVEYGALRVLIWLLGWLPFDTARAIGAWIGQLGYSPFRVRRRIVERQIAGAFPGLSESEVQGLSRASYRHLGKLAVELAAIGSRSIDELAALFDDEGDVQVLRDAVAEGKGAILCGGHLGNWEVAGAFLTKRGLPVFGVARHMANPIFDAYINRMRKRLGSTVVYDDEAVRRVPRALKEGRLVVLVSDQGGAGTASTFVPFFGRPARTPRGPAVFGIRYRCPVIYCAPVLQPNNRYRFVARRLDLPNTGDLERDVDTLVLTFTRELERMVRLYPEQYFWQHRRWKRQPPDTPEELRDPAAKP